MKPLTMEELVRLPERRAVARRADDANWGILKWVLAAFALPATLATIVFLTEAKPRLSLIWGLTLLVIAAIFLARKSAGFARRFRQILLFYLVFQLVVVVLAAAESGAGLALAGFLFPLTLLLFRLRASEVFGLLAVSTAIAVFNALQPSFDTDTASRVVACVMTALWAAVMYFVHTRIGRRGARVFLERWRLEVTRERERARMRGELDDARAIQLSMLPAMAPKLEWVDLASVSLPATEVGGDYFDFVPIDGSRLAVIVGDVAGHGMSSGLMLAAVRGGLYLLRDELADPLHVLTRLNRMVRDVAPRRMYVTLQIGVLERERLVLVNAGHMPALHYEAASRTVREIGAAATPLGTGLDTPMSEDSRTLAGGDVLLFYSDGAIELTDESGELFGAERLTAALESAAQRASAEEIRRSILKTIDRFKGDVTPEDDLTLVVARVR